MRATFDQIYQEIKRIFVKYGMSEEKAAVCARVHTESTYDGIYSHGTGRVARFVDYLQKGWVDPDGEPTLEKDAGAIRIYNGNMGPGILNALYAADRAMELADRYGIGMVGLKNTTHWMRGGSYGLYAARKGYIAFMWTNTESVMPPWGAKECRLGNNPFVMAVPGIRRGEPVLLDMAVSQYAYGKLAMTRLAGKKLPFAGGFDKDGNLTDDPGAIEESRRILPMGYWKGSSLSFMLDLLGALLSDGIGAADLDQMGKGSCGGASQVMILIDPDKISDAEHRDQVIQKAMEHLKSAAPDEHSGKILAPGEDFAAFRADHDKNGIFVEDAVWKEMTAL
ncbi:MAG: 3-dehydro-L-gulonate 2-dehydrogenase [Lachnospiraceae bacterium]|nr:3-dehydro-L-gulonate 2-dehydrogenase [Lachnospiraceae bacterium]